MKLVIDNEEHTLPDDKRITLICHQGAANVKVVEENVVTIDPEFCATIAATLAQTGDWDMVRAVPRFRELWALVWKDTPPPNSIAKGDANDAMRHTAGLIVAVVGAVKANKRIFLKTPEAGLHPSQQLGLTDLILTLTMEA